jgi:hypothetical protein
MDDLSRITYEDIAATPLGQALGDAVGHAVASRLVRRVMSPGDVLFRQGDAGDRLYVVLRGRLCAVIVSEGGAVQRLGEIGPGAAVGRFHAAAGVDRPWRAPPVFVSLTRAFTLASNERAQAAGRDADLTLRAPLDGYASSDFTHMDPIAEIGFRHASEHVTEWTTGVCSCAREG